MNAIEAHLLHQDTSTPLPVPAGLSFDTLQHLHATWGQAAERSFQRTVGQGSLTVCVGMSALHFLPGWRAYLQRSAETSRHPCCKLQQRRRQR